MSSMFDLPSAKRVRRDELRSPQDSPQSTPDRDIEDFLRQRITAEYAFTTAEHDDADGQDPVQSDEDEAELRLFAAPANATPATLKVRLSSPGPDRGDGSGFLLKKPKSYYFADEPTSDEELALQASAIDGSTVLELSRQPWPACAMPWKVRTITKDGIKKAVLVGHPPMLATVDEKDHHKRTRKGKKARIALRRKKQANKDKQEEKAKLAAEKEAAEREKRTRRNREKKVKKKAKAQAKKAEGGDDGEETTQPAVVAEADTSMQD